MNDIEIAKAALDGHTLALCKDGNVITSDLRGIAPMVGFIKNETNLKGYSAADKIVGKAAAMLFIYSGVTAVHALTMSESAKALFEKHGISYSYDTLTERIINRAGTGICPMELAVAEIEDVRRGVEALVFRNLDARR